MFIFNSNGIDWVCSTGANAINGSIFPRTRAHNLAVRIGCFATIISRAGLLTSGVILMSDKTFNGRATRAFFVKIFSPD